MKSAETALSMRKEILKGVEFPRNLFLTALTSFAFRYVKKKLSS
jgi:hypothetical protein